MIEEALNFLADQAVSAAVPKQITSGDDRKILYAIGGEIREIESKPLPRNHTLGHFDEVANVAGRFGEGDNKPVVWVGPEKVVVVIDDESHRLEKATLPLVKSEAFKRLESLRSAPAPALMDQKAFVRLLRIDLAGTLDPGALLNMVRNVRWSSQSDGSIGRQRESLGSEITARCQDGKDLPEEVTLRLPVYITQGARLEKPVRCSVEVEPADCKLRLLPLPNELERVLQDTLDDIAAAIAERIEDIPVYLGQP